MTQTAPFKLAALYQFVRLTNLEALRADLLAECAQNGLTGTLLLAPEGINGTLAGPPGGVDAFIERLKRRDAFCDLDVKYSHAETPPFHRFKVRLKREIVTLGLPQIDAAADAGIHVAPKDWNALISDPEVMVIDVRNDYEVAIGAFKGARNPQTSRFRDFPDWAEEALKIDPKTPIAMYCTGGIRCEKSTALLKARGFENVYHLKGGILKYLEETPQAQSLWQGDCFVFDQRVSVSHGLRIGDHELCHACRRPVSPEAMQSPLYVEGIACPACHETQSEAQRARYAERQKQMALARARKTRHIGARLEGPP